MAKVLLLLAATLLSACGRTREDVERDLKDMQAGPLPGLRGHTSPERK